MVLIFASDGFSHRFLGTAFCRGIFRHGGLEKTVLPFRSEAASAYRGTECDYQFQEPDDFGACFANTIGRGVPASG